MADLVLDDKHQLVAVHLASKAPNLQQFLDLHVKMADELGPTDTGDALRPEGGPPPPPNQDKRYTVTWKRPEGQVDLNYRDLGHDDRMLVVMYRRSEPPKQDE